MDNFFGKQILETMQQMMSDLWNTIFQIVETLFNETGWITENGYVKTACGITVGIASILLVLLASKHLFTTYILETDGDSEMDPLQFLVKASLALALIQMQNYIFYYLLKLSGMLCDEITGYIVLGEFDYPDLMNNANTLFQTTNIGPISSLGFNGAFVIIIIILSVKAALRAVELAIMKIMFPLFCCDILTPNREKWSAFSLAYLVAMFGYIIQLFCFRLCMFLYMEAASVYTLLGALALGYFAIKTPKWLEKFTYSTGVGQTAAGAGRTVVMTAMQGARFVP